MGELFRREKPAAALAWTGERLVSDVEGAIESEHLHRYFWARDLCRGKHVLDVASGEGYGSALLAQTAAHVIGVELDQIAVDHAAQAYQAPNLRYLQGETTKLPVESSSIDMVVSFETLEHFFEHQLFYSEVKRVLRPGGLLMLSTPDTRVYSGPNTDPNPYHVRELTSEEFAAELRNEFKHVELYRQRIINGSVILPDTNQVMTETRVFEQRDSNTFEATQVLPHAPYLVAFAGSAELPTSAATIYFQSARVAAVKPEMQVEFERLQAVEAASRSNAPLLQQASSDAEAARAEVNRLQSVLRLLQVETDRLRGVELAVRHQGPVLQNALDAGAAANQRAASLTDELTQTRRKMTLLEAEHADSLNQLSANEHDMAALKKQLAASAVLARQQTLVVQRLQAELAVRIPAPLPEPEPAEPAVPEAEAPVVVEPVAPPPPPPKLLIPLWLRRLVPGPLKPPLRLIKRAIRSQGSADV